MDKIAPKKSLGQHFLHDKNIAKKIVELFNPPDGSLVLEIGPGTGMLTELLLQLNITLLASELDSRSVDILKTKFSQFYGKSFFIYEKDFLKLDLEKIAKEYGQKIYVIGNIPYYITSPILFHLFESSESLVKSVIMVQREIAHRLKAKESTKEYGILSLATQMHGRIGKMYDVPGSCFHPPPKVTSSFFEIEYYKEDEGIIPAELRKPVHSLIRASFSQRRKKLSNSLKNYITARNLDIIEIPENITKYFNQRAEELSLQDFLILYNFLQSQKIKSADV